MEPTNKQTNERANQAEPTQFSFKSIMYICVYCVVIIVFGINKTDIHKIIMSLSILPRAFANLVQFPVFDCIRWCVYVIALRSVLFISIPCSISFCTSEWIISECFVTIHTPSPPFTPVIILPKTDALSLHLAKCLYAQWAVLWDS